VYLLFLRNFYFVNHLNDTKSQQIFTFTFFNNSPLSLVCEVYVGNLRQMSFQISIFNILSCSFVQNAKFLGLSQRESSLTIKKH
jgi:hypothetical protein